MNLINTNLDSLNIEEKENLIISQKDDNNQNFIEKIATLNSDVNSESSNVNSQITSNSQRTLTSEKFNQEKDLDLPNFTSTKNASFVWRIFHFIFYIFHNVNLLVSTCHWFFEKYNDFNTFLFLAHIGYFLSTFMLWLYYNRGCLTDANLNTKIKSNVDKSFKARILRSETGWIYFFAFLGAAVFIYGNIYYSIWKENDKLLTEFYNINFVGTLILSLIQILKIEQTLTENREYIIKKDISRSVVEILLFFGSLFFGTSYLIQIMYYFDDNFFIMLSSLKFIGNSLIILSGITMFYRYFFSGHQDLNTSEISNLSL
jgi:hypothetical protein